MNISVIISTYNGKDKIINVIKSLEVQTLKPSELIIVIDGSNDGTLEMLKNLQIKIPNCKLIYQSNMGRAAVKNRGAKESTGEILVFLDDDMTMPSSWLEAHLMHHQNYHNSLMSGRIETIYLNSKRDFIKYKNWVNNKWNDDLKVSNKKSNLINLPYIGAGNFSISKKLFNELNGFDDKINDLEDYDLAIRARLLNYKIYVNNSATAFHNDKGSLNCKNYINRIRQYNIAQEKLKKINPSVYLNEKINIRFVKEPKNLYRLIYAFLNNQIWIKIIDEQYLLWLPRTIRYRIYSAIIHSNGVLFPESKRKK